MNVSSIDNSGWAQALSGTQASSGVARHYRPPAGDGDGGMRPQGGPPRGGGALGEALASAFKSLGIEPSMQASGGSSSEATDGSSATGDVRKDMREFMHQLFSAMHDAGASGTSSGTSETAATRGTAAKSGKPDFAADLSALVTQIGNGSAPSGLASAFEKLKADLGGSSSSSSETGDGASQLTLQKLLSTMQQSLGYGSASSTAKLGNMLDTTI